MSNQHLLLRRLHSLTGILPIGVFLIAHLTTNSTLVWGAFNGRASVYASDPEGRAIATFQEEVSFINGMPMLLLIEITLWASIAFHSILGVVYALGGKNNLERYRYGGNLRYLLQRYSGYFGILFIFYHVATLRWGWSFLVPGGTEWSHHYAASTLAACVQGGWDGITTMGVVVSLFYFVGVSMLVFHFANGLWSSAITWGLTVSEASQKRWGYVCAAVGIGLMGMAWASIYAAVTIDPNDAVLVEQQLPGAEHAEPPSGASAPSHASKD